MTHPTHIPKKPPKGAQFLELLPLVLFFIAYQAYGLMEATIVLMAASSAALVFAYTRLRYVSMPLIVGTSLIVVFGALTIAMNDETFIKMRPTIVNLIFAGVLLVGIYGFKRGLLSVVFHMAFPLTDEGWRKLSMRWGFFFIFLACMNEIVWRTQPTDWWVNYKLFGVMAMTITFTLSQMGLIKRYALPEEQAE